MVEDVVVKKFTFAISSPEEFLVQTCDRTKLTALATVYVFELHYYYYYYYYCTIVTFRVSRTRREMYIGRPRLCLSLRGHMPTLLYGPGCKLGSGSGRALVVHCWRICDRCSGCVAMAT